MAKEVVTRSSACARRVLLRFVLPALSLPIGCVHRVPVKAAYAIEESAGESLLVPVASAGRAEGDLRTIDLLLPSDPRRRRDSSRQRCAIGGGLFSLTPDQATKDDGSRWMLKSPSVQGWGKDTGETDLRAEWNRFTAEVLSRKRAGCFAEGESVFALRRTFAEKMPLPASELLLFFYGFGGTGHVDLVPGMHLELERSNATDRRSLKIESRASSAGAHYEVIERSDGSGVILQPEMRGRAGFHLPKASGEDAAFRLEDQFKAEPLLRLYLQSIGSNQASGDPLLLGAKNERAMETLTARVEAMKYRGCLGAATPETDCVRFGEGTAVNLLVKVWINGKSAYRPMGTTLSYVIETLPQGDQARALQTVSVRRVIVNGEEAEIRFPKTPAGAHQVVLLSGDRIWWTR